MEPSKELEILEELEASTKYSGRWVFFERDKESTTCTYQPIGPEVDTELGPTPTDDRVSQVADKYGFNVIFLVNA